MLSVGSSRRHVYARLALSQAHRVLFAIPRFAINSSRDKSSSEQVPGRGFIRDDKFAYQSLPAEIRNTISQYALIPGSVFLPQVLEADNHRQISLDFFINNPAPAAAGNSQETISVRSSVKAFMLHDIRAIIGLVLEYFPFQGLPAPAATTAIGLLGTSKRIYEENHAIYWSQNTFYLPRGPAHHSRVFFKNISPAHKKLIKSIGIQFSLADMTLEALDYIRNFINFVYGPDPDICARGHAHLVRGCLRTFWLEKLIWVRRNWRALDEVVLDTMDTQPRVLDGDKLKDLLSGLSRARQEPALSPQAPWHFLKDKGMQEYMVANDLCILHRAENKILKLGWEGFRRELMGISTGQHYQET